MSESPEEPVIPDRADDDRDHGWGDEPSWREGGGDDEHLLRERPPHW